MTGQGWWVARPVELPDSIPLEFEARGNVGLALRAWPAEHVAKCLVFYHPDDAAELRQAQLARLADLYRACVDTGHELLVEVIPPNGSSSDAVTAARALEQIYAAGIYPDWWKLPPREEAATWTNIAAVVKRYDAHCRGVLLMGLETSEDALARTFAAAADEPLVKGFAVGRSIFAAAAEAWFAGRMEDAAVIEDVAARYARLIALWRDARGAAGMTV
jgi:5-dehydro-2-deoxygluconokinase